MYLGPTTTVDLVTQSGRRYVEMAGEMKEVSAITVAAAAAQVALREASWILDTVALRKAS